MILRIHPQLHLFPYRKLNMSLSAHHHGRQVKRNSKDKITNKEGRIHKRHMATWFALFPQARRSLDQIPDQAGLSCVEFVMYFLCLRSPTKTEA